MSSIIRSKAFLAIPIIVAIIIGVNFFLNVPGISYWAETVRTWAVIISNLALGIGIVNLLMTHGKLIDERRAGRWTYSIVAVITFFVFLIFGLLSYWEVETAGYQWIFQHVYTTLQQTMYASTGFYIASSAYRAFRARNVDAALLLIAGIFLMLTNAPVGEAIWSGFPVVGDWLMSTGQMPAYRTLLMITAFGFLAYAFRVFMGRERGFYAGGGE